MAEADADKAEYLAIYAIFQKFLRDYGDTEEREDLLEEMMALRAEFAFNHAIKGFSMDFEKALELLRNHNDGLTKLEQEQRDVLVAALDNLVDFAVAEEFQMSEVLPDVVETDEDFADCEEVFERYNKTYADIENAEIEYAMGIAAAWVAISESTVLTYTTQGDNRVRPWHMALEGTSYRKADFPAWLIPPIDYGCRCFLVEESEAVLGGKHDAGRVMAKAELEKPDFVNPVFEESVCKGGRIFGAAHSYFKVPKKKKKYLREVAVKIKKRWLEEQ